MAGAPDFHRGAAGHEAFAVGPGGQPLLDHGIGEFRDLAARFADREGDEPGAVAIGLGAGDEGIEAFEPVGEAEIGRASCRERV